MNLNGLTSDQVADKIRQGKVNTTPKKATDTTGKIILRNTLTIFNLVNLILALMIIAVGAYKNLLFILIAIANTLISIVNEIRAKHTIDKLKLISEQKPTVIRDGKTLQISQSQIVEGDLLILSLGDQILVDARVEQGTIEVNESYVTGEQSSVTKHPGDKLISGSFIVSGTCKATATAVGTTSQLSKLEQSARTIKTADSQLFTLMNNIVKYISYALIPIGVLLLWSRFRVAGTDTATAVTSTVAALINMIPEGLILLTSSVLALATIRLSKKQVLVQDLYSIETLARVDTICLDKTGTLTTGKMTVHDLIPAQDGSKTTLENALKLILSPQTADNATSTALKEKLLKRAKFTPSEPILEVIPFSSERKYSGVRTPTATYLMGAPEFIADDENIVKEVTEASDGYRTLAVIKRREHQEWGFEESVGGYDRDGRSAPPVTDHCRSRVNEKLVSRIEATPSGRTEGSTGRRDSVSKKPHSDVLLGFVKLEDELRHDAKDIINYFYDNNIDVKIISGDNLGTVTSIAEKVGVKDLRGVDLSQPGRPSYTKLIKDYAIFTRVTPAQKKELIKALRKQGSTVAMTGDGVNDILAMKEADCSIAIGEGSDAARRSAKLVLLDSDFAAVPSIIDEGRQSINNLERSTALFLAKTVYASILAVLFIFIPLKSPFASPVEMSLLNFACIGLPGLVLALEHNTERIKNRFTKNILQYSVPVGLTISISMLTLSCLAHFGVFSHYELATTAIFVTFTIDLVLIYWISRPLNALRATLLLTIIGIMAAAFLIPFTREFFDFVFLNQNGLIVTLVTIAAAILLFEILRRLMLRLSNHLLK